MADGARWARLRALTGLAEMDVQSGMDPPLVLGALIRGVRGIVAEAENEAAGVELAAGDPSSPTGWPRSWTPGLDLAGLDPDGPIGEHRDTWVCPRCGTLHYLADGDATDQICGCEDL